MQEPNVSDIKATMGLPKTTPFIGWLIHNPHKDDFLLKYTDSEAMVKTAWTQTPENALRFKRFKKAFRALNGLELDDRAIIVAAFDLGGQVLVASQEHESFLVNSNNPFRQPTPEDMQ